MKWIGSPTPGTPFTLARVAAVSAVALLAAGQWGACMNGGTLTDEQCNELVDSDCDKAKPGGAGGGTGGGGMGGAAAANCDATALRAAMLPNCPAHADVVAYEKDYIIPSCATKIGNDGCHSKTGLFPPNLSGVDLWKALAGKRKAKNPVCPDDYFADVTDGSKSLMLTKTLAEKPTCADGVTPSGEQMPRGKDPLTAEETACLTDYMNAIAEHCE